MDISLDIVALVTLGGTLCIAVGVYKNKFDNCDKQLQEINTKFEHLETDMDEVRDEFTNQYEKMWGKVDKLTDAVYEVKNYIQLIASCFRMEIKDDKED